MSEIKREMLGHYGLAALSGGLLAMSYAMHPLWWAAWLAPAPVIVATLRTPVASRRWLTLLAGVIAGISSFSYHLTVGGWLAALLILALVAVGWSSAIRLTVTFVERGQFFPAVLAVPATWAAIDTCLIHISPHGSAGSIAYSQMDALPVIQVASLGGIPAITFVVLLAGSLLGVLLARPSNIELRGLQATSVLTVAAISACLLFGVIRLHDAVSAPGAKVALIATDGVLPQPRSWDAFWKAYGGEITRVIGPDTIVLLPEAIVRLPAAAAEQAGRSLATYASQHKATVVVGVIVEEAGRLTNRALIAQRDGSSQPRASDTKPITLCVAGFIIDPYWRRTVLPFVRNRPRLAAEFHAGNRVVNRVAKEIRQNYPIKSMCSGGAGGCRSSELRYCKKMIFTRLLVR